MKIEGLEKRLEEKEHNAIDNANRLRREFELQMETASNESHK
jgi:hypothetical protein